MLKKFTVRNYRNFKDEICIDFENIAGYQFSTDCIVSGIIRKMLIYGRNATGKTNLGKALMDICTIFRGTLFLGERQFLNADSKEDAAVFSYIFQFDDYEIKYQYARFSHRMLREEQLWINDRPVFSCNFAKSEYSFDLDDIGANMASIGRYLESVNSVEDMEGFTGKSTMPFLRWLVSNVAFEEHSPLIQMANYVGRMTMVTAGSAVGLRQRRVGEGVYNFLENKEKLQDLEEFLNAMGIECRLVLKNLPDGQKALYFKHERLVPFYATASSGTLALFDLYRRLVPAMREPSFVYLDEFDAFYHYEMAENVIRFFKKKYPKCQMVMTTHNTNLMDNRLMRPDCVFILSRENTLTALCNATQRELREGHNLEKMYISGEFERYE